MAERVSAAQAHFAALVAEVAFGGQCVIIERRGKSLAALASLADLERLEQEHATSARPLGALALVGAWRDVPDEELDALLSPLQSTVQSSSGCRPCRPPAPLSPAWSPGEQTRRTP